MSTHPSQDKLPRGHLLSLQPLLTPYLTWPDLQFCWVSVPHYDYKPARLSQALRNSDITLKINNCKGRTSKYQEILFISYASFCGDFKGSNKNTMYHKALKALQHIPSLAGTLPPLVFVNSKAKVLSKVTTAIRHGDAEKYFTVSTFCKADFH